MPDLELRVWGLDLFVIGRLMLYKSFYSLWTTISHSQKWGGENGSKILPRNKGKLQKNRYKLVKMEMACMSLSVLFQKEALLKLSKARCRSQTWMCVSLQGLGGWRGTEAKGSSDKRENGHKFLSSASCSKVNSGVHLLPDLSKPYDFLFVQWDISKYDSNRTRSVL